jgi:2-polyprenyl-3-methyl-5-hydroxy-6-metoxy-1,4-benzoquinol methylase
MNEKHDLAAYEDLIREQHRLFPSIVLPPEYAELFEINTLQILVKLARYKFAAKLIKKSDEVLEVGSGTGLGTIFLSQHAKSVTGLEIKQHDYEAACAVNKRPNVEFILESVFEHDLSKSYDAIVSLDVIEHLAAAEGRKFVARLAQHCRRDGFAVIGTPSIYSFPYQSKYSQTAHVKCYDQQELVALMDDFFGRTIAFSMNDEIVHTGHPKMAWYYFVLGFLPRSSGE